jgi:DNA-directed RNA polymerase specialized sigma24 family protein
MHRAISAMIDGLSPVLSEALRLRYVEGLQPSTAATKAGCSRAALKKRLERAKRLVLECFHAGRGWVGG